MVLDADTAGMRATRFAAHLEPSRPQASLGAAGPFSAGSSRSDTAGPLPPLDAAGTDTAAGTLETCLLKQLHRVQPGLPTVFDAGTPFFNDTANTGEPYAGDPPLAQGVRERR